MANPSIIANMIKTEKNVIKKLIDMIPSEPIPNFAFRNLGKLNFKNVSTEYGFSEPSFSNGSAYGDLDNESTSCVEQGVLSSLTGIIGSIQATEAIKVLLDIGESLQSKLLVIDMKFSNYKVIKDF